MAANYAPDWIELGSVNGKLYGLFFKAANKSTVWYNVKAFKDAGVDAAEDLAEVPRAARTLRASGIAGLLDRRRGRLDAHRPVREHLPPDGGGGEVRPADGPQDQVDGSVREDGAEDMAGVFGDTRNIAGGTSGALQTDFPTSVNNVLSTSPKARDGHRGRLRSGRRHRHGAEADDGLQRVRLPVDRRLEPATSSAAATSSSCSRTTRPRGAGRSTSRRRGAATIWAKRGGYTSPNKNVQPSAYARRAEPRRRRSRSPWRRSPGSTCPTCSRLRSAARPGRASGRSSRTSSRTRRTSTASRPLSRRRRRRRTGG